MFRRSPGQHVVWASCGLVLWMSTMLTAADPSVAELIQAAKSGAEPARIQALDQLGAQGEKAAEAVPALTQLLADRSAGVRAHAAHALGAIGAASKPAAPALAAMLKDDDVTARRQAVKALTQIRPGPQVMIPLFVKVLEDSDPAVRMRILHAVSEAGPAAVPGLIEGLKNDKAAYWACLVLREIGPAAKDAVPALAAKLKDPEVEIRREAALTLGALQEAARSATPQLEAALDDEHARVAATFALGQIGQVSDSGKAKIQANATSQDKFLSTVSYWTLARLNPGDKELHRKAAEQLVQRVLDKDPYVRVAAARAMAALPPAPEITMPIWEKALANADETTAHHAMDALASLGPAAVPRLIDVLKHPKLRVQSAHILGLIGPPAAPAAEALAKLVADGDSRVALEATLALAKIGPDAKAAVPALAAALQQKDNPNAHAICYALGQIGPSAVAAEPSLLEAMKSQDRSLAVLSAWALIQIHPPSQRIAARALPILIAGLEDSLPQSRQAAAEALGSLGPLAKEAVAALQKASADSEPSVRQAAAEALKLIRAPAPK